MTLIYKISSAAEWAAAEEEGRYSGSAADNADGFIHLSSRSQVEATAARHFAGLADLVLVAIDSSALGQALKWEPSRGGGLFPHVYGVLPLSAVRWVKPLPLQDGRHLFPELEE